MKNQQFENFVQSGNNNIYPKSNYVPPPSNQQNIQNIKQNPTINAQKSNIGNNNNERNEFSKEKNKIERVLEPMNEQIPKEMPESGNTETL